MAVENEAERGAGSRAFGLQRWVQFGYVGVFLVSFYLLDKLVERVWDFFAEPEPTLVTLAAVGLGALTAYIMYRHSKVRSMADEVVGELAKVTWPTRKETWANTVVVAITSVIAALILFAYDALWASITDLIYKV